MVDTTKHCPKCNSTNLVRLDVGTNLKYKCVDCKYVSSTPVEA